MACGFCVPYCCALEVKLIILITSNCSIPFVYVQLQSTIDKVSCQTSLYTVRLLSFRTGIIKIICVKEMTLLYFSFRHTSFLTVHTDWHVYTASECLCRSRPLQWCLMYLSRLSGCPKSRQRDIPLSGISVFGTKSNQQVLNLTNTEGGRAQSLFVGPKTA